MAIQLFLQDHFLFVGPPSNPAKILDRDRIPTIFNKIAASGNRDLTVNLEIDHRNLSLTFPSQIPPDPAVRPPTRFLSRFDKSATNIKESQLFVSAGQVIHGDLFIIFVHTDSLQVPWALSYSKWYHQYSQYPLNALAAAATLSEYTLTDLSTWITSPDSVKSRLKIFKSGSDDDPNDPLLNPAHALYGARVRPENAIIGEAFMDWLVEPDGGQKVIRTFTKNGQVVVTEAPR